MALKALEKLKEETATELIRKGVVWLLPHVLLLASLALQQVRQTFLSLPHWLQLGLPAILIVLNIVVVIWALSLRERLRKSTLQPDIPTRTITILPRHEPSKYYWSLGEWHNKATMHISAEFIVTNLTDVAIRLSGATTKKAKGRGWVMVEAFIDTRRLYGWYDIPPHSQTFAEVEIWATPPTKKEGETLTTAIAILDQFGNEHWTESIEFSYGHH